MPAQRQYSKMGVGEIERGGYWPIVGGKWPIVQFFYAHPDISPFSPIRFRCGCLSIFLSISGTLFYMLDIFCFIVVCDIFMLFIYRLQIILY